MALHYGPRGNADGTLTKPFGSPIQAAVFGAASGSTYYFQSGAMASAVQLEFQNNYYQGLPFCCVFRSPYNAAATTNRLNLNIPMKGLLVQRDALDIRAAVYWSAPITYNTLSGTGNNTADSGYAYRRVLLGGAGSHGIYNTSQQSCNWGDSVGSVGAGFTGATCGTWPDALQWGTGQSGTATYTNMSGTWSHWIFWGGVNIW
jgi:hypothetical protein